ncbi:dihydropteroate synthase [Helicobacter anatolicus]|uniref:dihydropteroate synthase n=1 Tax=Helicobacter anatolicus TaxID=2905874 RepID=UPI001E64E4C9|nr:dihydropteroate synthase [Helicobacter anatolicus]MCE3040438.1 dihydropteroate synthase [Helicobacter anatolicus]
MEVKFLNQDFIVKEIAQIGSDIAGAKIMEKKAKIIAFKITNLPTPAVMILKQEALSVGGDFATPKECILVEKSHYDGILFGTIGQLQRVIAKLSIQPFGLKELGGILKKHISCKEFSQKIMAVINVTPDSFFKSSRNSVQSAITQIETLIAQKQAEIIDIGGASSRPGSALINPQEELERLQEIFKHIAKNQLFKHVQFSIDSYNTLVAQNALDSGFSILNDVSGLKDIKMIQLAGEYQAQVVLMHTQGTPQEMQNLTNYKNLFLEMDEFFVQKIATLQAYGVCDIILDIGFGFAKNMEQNMELIKNLAHFQKFGYPLLVGASRKSTIQKILNKEAEDTLSGTLALHFLALQNGANILRVHDVIEHRDIIKIFKAYYA